MVSHAPPHLGQIWWCRRFRQEACFERQPAWHGASNKSALQRRTCHPSCFPFTVERPRVAQSYHTASRFQVTFPFALHPPQASTGGWQPFFNYTFLHFEKRMLACVSQKRGDGCHRPATLRGPPLTGPGTKAESQQVSLHSEGHLQRRQPRGALTGKSCEQPGVVKRLGWLNATALGCYANVYIPDVTHATESARHELSVCSPSGSHRSRLEQTHSWVRGETWLRKRKKKM